MLPVVLAPLLLSLPVQDTHTELEAFIQSLVAPALEHEGVPGLSIAVMREGELVFVHAYGWADERLNLPMKVETAFPIGSLGHGLVSATALREVERGALTLDAQLGKLLPDVPAALQPITLRQLLDGTSGLPASTALYQQLSEKPPAQRLARKEFLELLAALPAQSAPGKAFAADSSAWLVLPLVVAEAGKRSFGDSLLQEVCTPLELSGTLVRGAVAGVLGHAADCREVLEGRALEVWSGFEPRECSTPLLSTPSDLVRWQTALFQHKLLAEESTRVLTGGVLASGDDGPGLNACFELGKLGGQPSWRHVGGIAGWRGALSWYGDAHLSICVLANCNSARVGPMEEEIARFLLQMPPHEPQDLPLAAGESAALCGTYQLGTLRVRIFERDGRLWYESASEVTFRLRSQGLRRFLSAAGDVRLRFSDETPKAASFDETRKGATSVAKRAD